jgi:hypothetical protein
VSPILGIYASQISGHLFAPSGAYDSIATTTVGSGGTASVTFSSIPSTYTHLQVRYLARSTRANTADNLKMTLNSSTTYAWHYIYGDGASPVAGGASTQTSMLIGNCAGGTATSGIFAGGVLDILDYTSTSKNKTIRGLSGVDRNGSGEVFFDSGLDYSTPAAVTSITFSSWNSANLAEYSQFALYGIKGGN